MNERISWFKNFVSVVKFVVDIAVPAALVLFAVKTDRIQQRQELIQRDQTAIQKGMLKIAGLQDKAEIGFHLQTEYSKSDLSYKALSIIVYNSGAPIHGLEINSFSYLNFEVRIGTSDDDAISKDIPALEITNDDVSTTGNVSGEIAVVNIGYSQRFLRALQNELADTLNNDGANNASIDWRHISYFPIGFTLETVVQIELKDRDDTYSRYFYHLSNGRWSNVGASTALRQFIGASSLEDSIMLPGYDDLTESVYEGLYASISRSSRCPFYDQVQRLPDIDNKSFDASSTKLMGWRSIYMIPSALNTCDLTKWPSRINPKLFSKNAPDHQ
jgi:hypothetical protein